MTILIGVSIIILVLFMVFAMALAEWADKDPGELWASLTARQRAVSVSRVPAGVPAAAAVPRRTGQVRRARQTASAKSATRRRSQRNA